MLETHPRAKAPDHWSRKPRAADIKIADVLQKFQLNDRAPGGSSQGIKATKKRRVIGVVFHIKLFWVSTIRQWRQPYSIIKRRNIKEDLFIKETYAKAVQFSCCCRLDQSILLTALGIIHDKAMHAPKKWNSRSVTVATATPIDTIVNASTWDRQK